MLLKATVSDGCLLIKWGPKSSPYHVYVVRSCPCAVCRRVRNRPTQRPTHKKQRIKHRSLWNIQQGPILSPFFNTNLKYGSLLWLDSDMLHMQMSFHQWVG